MYDLGWIVNADTRERVWEMSYWDTEHAGGALKNRIVDDYITLQAGDYLIYFVTDDSHSPQEWNQLPPYDPYHWGITMWGVDTDLGETVVKEYQEIEIEPIIEINHIRNNQFEMEGFTLKRDVDLHIYALGEYSRSRHKFVDFGWIMDAHSREIVWQMDYENTEHAGGSQKNRVFDSKIFLPVGSYLVFYISDDSHAYKHWNAKQPYQPEAWGITISPAKKEFSYIDVKEYNEDDDKNILAQIIQVRNKENLIANFSLNQSAKVKIYAIGEGDHSKMYDYGWIEDEDGKIVWEMRYKSTFHAGGAKKNRMVNDIISLNRGSYLVHYKTDGSHSYRSWNSTPPDDLFHWGITIIKYED